MKLITCIGCLLGLLGCLCAEETAPLRFWVVKSKPFPGSIRISIPKLQLQGYSTVAPILHFDVIDSVKTTELTSRITRADKDGAVQEEKPKKHYGVRIKLMEMQARLVITLMKINLGEHLLLRRGKDPIAAFYIHASRQKDGTLDVSLQDRELNLQGIPNGRSVDSGDIEMTLSTAEDAKTLCGELSNLVNAGIEDTKRGTEQAVPPNGP